MSKTVSKEEIIKQMQTLTTSFMGKVLELKLITKEKKDSFKTEMEDFILYFNNAVNSSNPFSANVEAMRKQGIWLPDKINASSVRANYFNVAKAKLYEAVTNVCLSTILNISPKQSALAIQTIFGNTVALIDNLIKGDLIINEV